MEKWDLYDQNGNKLNEIGIRGQPLQEGKYHLVVEIWTINDENEILITQRDKNKPFGLLWECTGGSVIAGESSIEGAIRELYEETGLKANKNDLEKVGRTFMDQTIYDIYVYRHNFDLADVCLQEGETVAVQKVTKEELLVLVSQGQFFLRAWERLKKTKLFK